VTLFFYFPFPSVSAGSVVTCNSHEPFQFWWRHYTLRIILIKETNIRFYA